MLRAQSMPSLRDQQKKSEECPHAASHAVGHLPSGQREGAQRCYCTRRGLTVAYTLWTGYSCSACCWCYAMGTLLYLRSRPPLPRRSHTATPRRSPSKHRADRRVSRRSQCYDDYMRSSEWSRRRTQILLRAGYRCEFCNSLGPLEVHHLTYEHLGDERSWELRALCKPCHNEVDRLRRRPRSRRRC